MVGDAGAGNWIDIMWWFDGRVGLNYAFTGTEAGSDGR